jgi:hypothetical protein
MHYVEPKLPVRKTLEATVVVESEIPCVQNCIGSNMGSEFVDTFELTMGVGDQQKSQVPCAPYCALEVVFP